MSRSRTRAIKATARDATGVVIPVSAYDSMAAYDAAWRGLLRLPVGYSVKRVAEGWIIFDDAGEVAFEWATLDVALQEVVGYGD